MICDSLVPRMLPRPVVAPTKRGEGHEKKVFGPRSHEGHEAVLLMRHGLGVSPERDFEDSKLSSGRMPKPRQKKTSLRGLRAFVVKPPYSVFKERAQITAHHSNAVWRKRRKSRVFFRPRITRDRAATSGV